jgi:RNA polymerase sigma-70 factor (ECF subfamily)
LAFLKNIASALSDDELVEKYRSSGDLQLLADLYQRYMELVYGVCLKYLQDTEEAKDCVINIYEELILKVRKHEISHFKAWLYQLAKNHCLMKLRKNKTLPVIAENDVVYLAGNVHLQPEPGKEEQFSRMEYCMGQLAQQQRQAIELFYLKEKCYKEIASETGIEMNKVRSFIQNGRRNLKICMDKQLMENTG